MFEIVGGPEASFVNALSLGLQRLSFKPVWVPRIIPSRFATNSNFRFINHKLKMNSKLQCINACIFSSNMQVKGQTQLFLPDRKNYTSPVRNAVLTEVLFCEGENQLILFSPKPPRCGRNIVLPVLLLCRRCIFHMNKPGHKLNICPYFHLQTFNKLILHLLHDHCSPEKLTFTCQSQLSRKFHGRFLTIILHLSAKAALRLYSLAFRVHFPDGALTENILSTKKLQKVHSIQYHL